MAKSKEEKVKDAEKAHKAGEPLPSGISYQPYRAEPYMTIEDAEKLDKELAGGPAASNTAPPVENAEPAVSTPTERSTPTS